jgi:hypothetical protein
MSLEALNSTRKINYIIVFILIIVFIASLYSINFIYPKQDPNNPEKQNEEKMTRIRKIGRFGIPFMTLLSFFAACVIVAKMIANGGSDLLSEPRDQFIGIYFLLFIGAILTFMNLTVLKERSINEYIRGKKFSVIGVFMALGVSAIVFGFLDNFGMKLGTEALDDTFVQLFLGPFSTHNKFVKHKQYISENLKLLNNWSGGKWRSVINQLLRCKDDISSFSKSKKFSDNRMNDLVKDINEFVGEGAKPLYIPDEIRAVGHGGDNGCGIKEFVKNIKNKYDVIDGSKSMMGNTFSDFIGAILGAAILNLFIYMTSYDGVYTGDDKVDNSFLLSNLNKLGPFMEALFISIGCLIPIFLNIAITRDSTSSNNAKAWIVVGIIGVIMVAMMYLSVTGMKEMSERDKKNSIKKTLDGLKERLDLQKNRNLHKYVNEFINNIDRA